MSTSQDDWIMFISLIDVGKLVEVAEESKGALVEEYEG